MSSFAAGFFRSLERNSQAQLDAQREQARMEAIKKLDLKYQRNKRVEQRNGEWVEITTDGEGVEIPGLSRKLNEAEVARIRGDMAKSQVDVAAAEDALDPEYRSLARTERLEDLRFGPKKREMEVGKYEDQLRNSAANRAYMGSLAANAGSGRRAGQGGLEANAWVAASPEAKLADVYNSLGREIQAAIEGKKPKDEFDEQGANMANVYRSNMDAVISNILSRSKSREEALGKVRRYLTTGTID